MGSQTTVFAGLKDTYAYRRALREKLCAELSSDAYDKGAIDTEGRHWFCYPAGKQTPSLRAFAHVEDGVAYISFRGSCNIPNFLADGSLLPTGQPRRHRGFYGCWKKLRGEVEEWLNTNAPKEVVLTGHSLGGAVAQLAAFDLAPNWHIRAVVCFGAPFVGWQKFATAFNATAIKDESGTTLGDVTTTYVFKSDLWRYVLLMSGYQQCGQEIVIDEKGYPVSAEPWFLAALTVTNRVTEEISAYTSPGSSANTAAAQTASDLLSSYQATGQKASQLSTSDFLQIAKPFASLLFLVFPFLMMAALAAIPLTAMFSVVRFVVRDYGYHKVRARYLNAMTARMERWVPVTFREKGEELLATGDATDALPDLTAALEGVQKDFPEPLSLQVTRHLTWQLRLKRAEAYSSVGNYAAAIADLTALIDTYPAGKVEIPSASIYSDDPLLELRALERRAKAFALNGQQLEAMADCERMLSARPEDTFDDFSKRVEIANRKVGGFFSRYFRSKKGYAEADRMRKEEEEAFRTRMVPTFEWAHYHRAASAFWLNDFKTVVDETTAALALDPADAWAYHLRGQAYERLDRRADALADFDKSVELQPTVAGFYLARALSRVLGVDMVDPNHAPGEAFVHLRVNSADLPLMEADLRKTLELEPTNERAARFLEGVSQVKASAGGAAAAS